MLEELATFIAQNPQAAMGIAQGGLSVFGSLFGGQSSSSALRGQADAVLADSRKQQYAKYLQAQHSLADNVMAYTKSGVKVVGSPVEAITHNRNQLQAELDSMEAYAQAQRTAYMNQSGASQVGGMFGALGGLAGMAPGLMQMGSFMNQSVPQSPYGRLSPELIGPPQPESQMFPPLSGGI